MVTTKRIEAKETAENVESAEVKGKEELSKKQSAARNEECESSAASVTVMRLMILVGIWLLATAVRLFSVLKWESVIHEFDPYFNYRTTRLLVEEGFYSFLNWFDSRSWYPLGRVVGGTLYPGLMVTAGFFHWVLNLFNFTVDIRNVCVFMGPLMSGVTAVSTYLFTAEAMDTRAGLFAGVFAAIIPGYIARSAGGSYDNESVAIPALMLTFWLWVRAVNRGSAMWSLAAAISYFYMVAAWGGYVFIINLIPLHVLILMLLGRCNARLYSVYCTFYIIGTIAAMQVPFIGFQPIRSSEHFASHGVFGLLQLWAFYGVLQRIIKNPETFIKVRRTALFVLGGILLVAFVIGSYYRAPMLGRFYAMFDVTYAKIHIPIIASVSEHQPNSWGSLLLDTHMLMALVPAALYFCFGRLQNPAIIFVLIYAVSSLYFASVMVRLVLVLAPIVCVLGGITLSTLLRAYARNPDVPEADCNKVSFDLKLVVTLFISFLLILYLVHCTWTAAYAYSSPSIVLEGRDRYGQPSIWDDFREAYYWLRQNTRDDAKIMSWWDYGYQLGQMADRTTLVDNNTWNNTHIATVGRAWSSPEPKAYEILRGLDADYALVIFGGLSGYSGDDINKFLWMVRIAQGVFPDIREKDFFSSQGQYTPGKTASSTMLNSLMYRLSYYRFADMPTPGRPRGFDNVRQVEIGLKNFELEYFEEVFTSEHWLVRIYKLKDNFDRTRIHALQ